MSFWKKLIIFLKKKPLILGQNKILYFEETYIRDGITKCRDTTKTLQNQKYTPKNNKQIAILKIGKRFFEHFWQFTFFFNFRTFSWKINYNSNYNSF